MEHRVRVNLMGTALVLAAGIVVSFVTSTWVASRALSARVVQQARQKQEITVKGSARVRVRSDRGVWRVTVVAEGREIGQCYGLLEASVQAVRGFLTTQGFPASEVAVGSIDTETHHARDERGDPTRQVDGYTLTRVVTVTSPDVDRVEASASEVTRLIQGGIAVRSGRPEFYCTKLPDLKVSIMGDAAEDARARAEEIVRRAKGRLGPVRDAQMGVLQITRPDSTEVASYGIYDTGTIEKDVTSVVTVTFGVETGG